MSIDILSMGRFSPNDRAINIALPVLAYECEATPPIDNYLDAYEDAVIKFISIGISIHGISVALNATESLIEEIVDRLERKDLVEKEIGHPWKLTENGQKYLDGTITDRESDNSMYGFMFVNAIKKDVLPFFYQGDINQISSFKGAKAKLPLKLTLVGDEEKTFVYSTVKRSKLREAFKKYCKNSNTSKQFDEGEITLEEAVDLFEGLDSFDEEDFTDESTLADVEEKRQAEVTNNMYVRALNCPPQKVYLTMRIIINPQEPGGYTVESPFDFNGIDNFFFQRQIQWLVASQTTYIDGEPLEQFLSREICKISPMFKNTDKDFSVFALEKVPLLRVYKEKYSTIFEDLGRIYSLMQRESSLLEKENIVNNISRCVVESIFNLYFKSVDYDTLKTVSNNASSDLRLYGIKSFKEMVIKNTSLNHNLIFWNDKYTDQVIYRMRTTKGNSITEKFMNLIILNYYYATPATKKFLSDSNAQTMYDLAGKLNDIRKKVSHDTNERFIAKDYEFYMGNVFVLINNLLEALKED